MLNFILLLAAIMVVVFIHELGHYWAARWCGYAIKEFSVGFGSPVWQRTDKHGTEWKLGCVMLGGYVRFGDDYVNASPLQKFLVSAAGPFVNFSVLAIPAIVIGKFGAFMSALGDAYVSMGVAVWDTAIRPFTYLTGNAAPVAANIPDALADQSTGIIFMTYLLVVNVGVLLFNLLPIPPLDGGGMLMAVLERIIGRAKATAIEQKLSVFGAIFILWLMVSPLITYFVG